jgi:hypothetical protein
MSEEQKASGEECEQRYQAFMKLQDHQSIERRHWEKIAYKIVAGLEGSRCSIIRITDFWKDRVRYTIDNGPGEDSGGSFPVGWLWDQNWEKTVHTYKEERLRKLQEQADRSELEHKRLDEERERKEYERLKAKFEKGALA